MAFWSSIAKFFVSKGFTLGATGTLGNIIAGITGFINIATLAVGVRGFMQARQMMAKGQDILLNKTSAGGKIPVIYGTRRVGAQIIYMDVSGNDSRDLYVVYALSVGECDEILGRTIELDGNPLTDSARFRDGGYIGSDKISSGSGSLNTVSQNGTGIDAGAGQFGTSPTLKYRYVMNLHHGAASQTADPMLVASMPNWTSAHRLDGICYIAAHYGYDKEGIWSGVPQLTVQVRGKKVYDPRDSGQTFGTPSTYEFSDNPALTFLDYITNNEYGKGLTASQINMTTFSSAANVCDTEVDQPHFNGTAQSLTWSANSGDNFFTIAGANANEDWWQNKIGELLDLFDANGNGVIDGDEIIDVQRSEFFDSNEEYIVFINNTFSSTYSSQTGSSLLKVKRFHCNGYLDTNKNVMENAKELLANMRGIFLYINGQYELSIEDTGTSTFSINDNHIIADAGISVDYGNKDKKANKVIVEFFNANKKYELDTATVLHDASPEYYSDDGDEILEIKAEFPYISDPYIAYNMGKAILTRSRNQTTMQFLGTPEMYKLNVGDIVDLTYAGLGFSGKVCRVEALELQPNGLVAVSLIEYFDVYTWEVPPQEEFEDISDIPSAYAVAAPTNVSFTDTDASSTGRPFITWDLPTDYPYHQWRVNIFKSGFPILQILNKIVDVNSVDLNFIPKGTGYTADISAINSLGIESDPTQLSFNVGDEPTGTDDLQDDAVTDVKVLSLSADKLTAGTIDADVITVTNFTADNISGDIDKLEPISLTPNTSIGTSYTQIGNVVLSAPDITTAGGGHTPFFSLVISATLSGGGAQMDLQGVLTGITTAGGSSPTIYTAAESGQDHNFSSGLISQSLSGSFNTKVFATCSLTLYAKKNTGTITVNKIQGVYAGLRGG
jgi:predicted phage tail protein